MSVSAPIDPRCDERNASHVGEGEPIGQRRIAPPASRTRTSLILGGALAASFLITSLLESGRPEPLTGYLRAETARLSSEREVRLVEWLVAEGETVEAGTPVAKLVDEGAAERVAPNRKAVAALEAELARARARAEVDTKWRLKSIESEVLETRLRAAEYLQKKLQREMESFAWNEFSSGGLASRGGLGTLGEFESVVFERQVPEATRLQALLRQDAARNAVEVHQAQMDLCEARLRSLEELEAKLPAEILKACGVDEIELRLTEARAELTRVEAVPTTFPLVSSAYGVLGTVLRQAGEVATAGTPLVEVYDVAQSHLVLPVPSRDAPQYAPGIDVELLFPGGERRTGRVESVRPEAIHPREAGLLFGGDDALASVRVKPTGKLWPVVPIGAAVHVTIRER
ncbi:MAG: hypothetical protein WD066_13125 [Planctomycetaceae bacterium]